MIPAVKINSFLIDQSDPWSLRRRVGPLSKANTNKIAIAMLKTPSKTKMSLGNKLILHHPTVGIQNKAVRNTKTHRRRPYCFDVVSNHLRDFMTSSSMHGLKYAAEKEASWVERYVRLCRFLLFPSASSQLVELAFLFCSSSFFLIKTSNQIH